ncbi:MAG: PAS domain-containing protein [Pseudomonadota bacterium]
MAPRALSGTAAASMWNIFENDHTVMLLIDPENGRIVDANAAATRFYGWSRDRLRCMHIDDINMLRPHEIDESMQFARTHGLSYFAFRHRLASGAIRDVEVASSPMTTERGTLLFSVVHDVSEKQAALRRYREADALCQLAIESVGGTAWEWSPGAEAQYIAGNPANLIGRDVPPTREAWRLLVPAEDLAAFDRAVEDVVAGDSDAFATEYRLRAQNGADLWLRAVGRAHRDDAGRLKRVLGLDIDITEDKVRQERLEATAEALGHLQRIIDQSPAVAVLWEVQAGWPAPVVSDGVRQWGYAPADLTSGRVSFADLVHPDDHGRMERAVRTVDQGQPFSHEYRIVTRDGQVREVMDFTTVVAGACEGAVRCQGVLLDITERRTAERDLQRANRALGALVTAMRRMTTADAPSPEEAVCRALAETEGYLLAWVGAAGPTPDAPVRILAKAGAAIGFLDAITMRVADVPEGAGPTARALRTGEPQVISEIDPDVYAPAWRDPIRRFGIRSAVSLPIRDDAGHVYAALGVCADAPDAFTERERDVLEALVGELEAASRHRRARQRLARTQIEGRRDLEQVRDTMYAMAETLSRTLEAAAAQAETTAQPTTPAPNHRP